MNRILLRRGPTLEALWVVAILVSCLYVVNPLLLNINAVHRGLSERFLFPKSGMLWIVCLYWGACYLAYLRWRSSPTSYALRRSGGRDLFLIGLLSVAVLVSGRSSLSAATLMPALIFFATASLARWIVTRLESSKCNCEIEDRIFNVLIILTALLFIGEVSTKSSGVDFEYRSRLRWSGPWGDPNAYGTLMGTGMVIAMCLLIDNVTAKRPDQRRELHSWMLQRGSCIGVLLCIDAIVFMALGLLHSYSRGAWIGSVCATVYVLREYTRCANADYKTQIFNGSLILDCGNINGSDFTLRRSDHIDKAGDASLVENLRYRDEDGGDKACRKRAFVRRFSIAFYRGWLPLAVLTSSILTLALCHFKYTNSSLPRRLFSLMNADDMSVLNRLAAYEGSLQIMADHPFIGSAWNESAKLYGQYYSPPQMAQTGAVETNDYFAIGRTLGLPGLICFLAYIWLSFVEVQTQSRTDNEPGGARIGDYSAVYDAFKRNWRKVACRAGTIVLLVGFWFDGGLFKLPTASAFWILLELGGADGHQPSQRRYGPASADVPG